MRLKAGIVSLMTLLLALGLFGLQATTVRADSTTDSATDFGNAVASMPEGLSIKQYFTPGNFTGTNSATVTDDKSSTDPTQAVRLTNDKNQLGTIWADDDYYFDLTRNQKASMWVYFGNRGTSAGDGMAFVLQNDPRGTAATATKSADGLPASGESLGVWGYPDDYTTSATNGVAGRAIQASWALEFDTFPNTQDPSSNVANMTDFDYYKVNFGASKPETKNPHIASAYPAQSSTYYRRYYSDKNYATTMNHQGIVPDVTSLSDGAWHHVTMQYTAPTTTGGKGLMTYTFNDKDPNTGQSATGKSSSYEVDPTKLTPATNPASPTATMAKWGFTGSTGSNYENNLVVFEQIPGLVDASAASTTTDVTTNKPVSDGAKINGGDRLRIDYNLTYNEGRTAWKDIQAQIKVPTNVSLTAAKVTYADGTTETIPIDGLSGQALDYTLQKTLDNSGSTGSGGATATISLYGRADNVDATVSSTVNTFRGSNALATADAAGFTIQKSTGTLALNLTSNSTVSMAPTDTTNLTGSASLTGATTSSAFTLHSSVNNGDETTTKFDGTDSSQTFSSVVKGSDLKQGTNTIDLYATDDNGDSSGTVTVTVTIGALGFGTVAPNSSFADTVLTGQATTIERNDDWSLTIDDSRGSGSGWTLQAATTPFTGKNIPDNTLKGSLVYVDSNHNTTVLGATPMTVMTHENNSTDTTTNVVDGWTADTGLLLKTNSDALQDDYSGTVTWSLINGVS